MIKINLDDICYECVCPDLDCDYIETVCGGGTLIDRDYTISCTKTDVCKYVESKRSEEDHEWWK